MKKRTTILKKYYCISKNPAQRENLLVESYE